MWYRKEKKDEEIGIQDTEDKDRRGALGEGEGGQDLAAMMHFSKLRPAPEK